MRLIDADELVEYLKKYHGMSQGIISDVEHFPAACNVSTMVASLHKLMGEDYSNCVGATRKDGYLAFYHERGLYSVEHEDSGIVSLVYAKNPYEAIDLVDEFRRMAKVSRMTNAEAIETIKTAIAEVEWNYPMDYTIAFETAIEALEKQVPKKPAVNMAEYGVCPTCGRSIDTDYCIYCGQAIDWSEA